MSFSYLGLWWLAVCYKQAPAVIEDEHLRFSTQAHAVGAAEAVDDPGLQDAAIRQVEGSTIPVAHDYKDGHLVALVVGAHGETLDGFLDFTHSQLWHIIRSLSLR